MYGQTSPMSSDAFKKLAKSLINKRDAALLDVVSLDPQLPVKTDDRTDKKDAKKAPKPKNAPSSGSDFIDNWREWEQALRLNLAKHRAIKLGRAEHTAPELPVSAAAAAVKAVTASETPLEVELALDKARWNAIEELQGNNYFHRNTIFAYLLKLLIIERRNAFQVETGFAEYKSLYTSIMENRESTQSGISPAGESI